MPVANPDFSAFVQRAKDLNPESIFVFVPGGAQPAALGKAFAERGMDPNKIKIMAPAKRSTRPRSRPRRPRARPHQRLALRLQPQDQNERDFVKAFNAEFKRNPDFFAVGGYDGMHVIYEALKKTGGKPTATPCRRGKGMKWMSPRGPVSIDDKRDTVQTVYIRKVEKVGNAIVNVEFDKVENV